jgi:hypothetical protein
LTKEFIEKRDLILKKLEELKKSNKNIEEIYKYTSDIILEEEGEEEDEDESRMRRAGLDSQRSKSVV